jgi:hypothetical protein
VADAAMKRMRLTASPFSPRRFGIGDVLSQTYALRYDTL